MKKLFLLIISVFIFKAAQSQEQSAVFSHYHISPILISPAVAGFTENHQIQMNIRSQWTGFPESPKSYGIGYNGPIGKTLGLGVGLMSETLGNMTNARFQLNYAFRYKLRDVKFAAGFSTEFITKKLAQSALSSPLYEEGDQLIEDAVDGTKIFDASLGFWGTLKDNTFIGLTLSNLVVAKIGDIEAGTTDGSFFRYMMLHFGHEFEIEQYNFKLRPSLLVQRVKDRPFQADFNLLGSFIDDKLIAGASYRAGLGGAVGLLLGTNIDVFRLYYSYDLTFQNVQKYNGGTHEVTIAFDFEGGKKKYDRSVPKGGK
jgi:type IX secretion system PorP/SprF family membrane protein